ncbi:MAG TPA: retroviral-like aspartic protease family protein [Fimbriimonadaceae bacterium]|nr:retroviral-like aspartic protease family protein [Fimbriimonadaceae bacterium]
MISFTLSLVLLHPPVTVLDHVREALAIAGGSTWKETRLAGKASYYGVEHSYSMVYEPDGRYLQVFKGPLGETYGYDGTTFWEINFSRTVEKLDFEDRDRQHLIGLLLTSGWIDPKAPVTVTETGNTLHMKLSGADQEETVEVDPATWLPTLATIPDSAGNLTIKLGNWKDAGDRKIPTHLEITDGGLTDTVDADQVEASEPGATTFSIPDWHPDDVSFDASKPAAVETKKAISGHILVHPMLNGQDAGWFILDSGAEVTVIDKTTADNLKLKAIGEEPLTGVGGTVKSSFRLLDELTLGPAKLKNLVLSDLDLSPIGQALGIKLGGVLGADFLRRSVVGIDLGMPTVDVYSRDTYTLPSGSWLPVRFSTGNPTVEAAVDGAPKAWYRFDTGADGSVVFHSAFVKKNKMLEGKETRPAGTGGVGGMITARSGIVKWFELGGHRFQNPRVLFSTAEQGAFAEHYLGGNIGHDFMKPFKVVLDFSGYRLALIPKG